MLDLQDDHMCFVCGSQNKHGFRLNFEHPEPKLLKTHVVFTKEHQGFKNIVHGGMIGMVLDEMVVNLAWIEKMPAVTAELKVRLKKAARVGEKIEFIGRLLSVAPRMITGIAVASSSDGEILAEAEVKCLRIKADHNTLAPTVKER